MHQAVQPWRGNEYTNPTEDLERPGQVLYADFEGPMAGSWYLHVITDQYSKYPAVQVVNSTAWEELQPKLEETMACQGVPRVLIMNESNHYITPYNSHGFAEFARGKVFKHRTDTPRGRKPNSQ